MKRIGMLTSGGDCQSLNATMRGVVNGRGFEVLADSNEKIQQFLSEYSNLKSINDADFFAKWVKFDTYRKIAIQNR